MTGGEGERRLRILHIVESAATGVARHVLDLVEGAGEAGHQTDVIYSPLREDDLFRAGRARLNSVDFEPLAMRRDPGPWDVPVVSRVRRLVAANGPYDVIHGHSSKGGMLARLGGIGSGSAVVYTPHAISTQDPGLGSLRRFIFKAGEKALARLTDRIIAVSTAEADHIASLGVPRDKLIVIPNGVSRPTGPSRESARAALGLPDDVLVAGFVGRLSRQKGIDIMIASFAYVAQADPKARLVVIGDGEGSQLARQMAEMVGCASQILWLGTVDARQYFPAFDLFTQPSRYEGFSYAVLEAASYGIPILTTDVGGSRETVTAGVNGLIVPSDSSPAFSDAFVGLVADRDRLAGMAEAAREALTGMDGRQRMVEATLALYQGLGAPAAAPNRVKTGRAGSALGR